MKLPVLLGVGSSLRNKPAMQVNIRAAKLHADRLGDGEDVVEIVQLGAAAWRGAADEVEHPAVLQAVIGKPPDAPRLAEIHPKDALVRAVLLQECDLLLGAL